MGQELHPPPSPSTILPPEDRFGVQLVAVAVFIAILFGAAFFLGFLGSASMLTVLYVGLGLFLVELASVIAVTPTGWQEQLRGIPLLVFGLGWLAWNLISGTCLVLYVLFTYPPSLLQVILVVVLGFAPMGVTVAVMLLADMVRRWLVSRHAGRT